jgi:hypothetical protein
MSWRFIALLLAAASLFGAAKKTIAEAKGENVDLTLSVTLYIDPAGVKDLLGAELDHFIVAAVKVEPKSGKAVLVDRDDFLLRTDVDGERTKPLAPSQIAGRGALIVTRTPGSAPRVTGGMGPSGYPGGYPGGYPPGGYPPGGYPGDYPPAVSGGSGGEGDTSGAKVTVRDAARDKENPLEQTLKTRELPQAKTGQPVSGLLYFSMEKQKMKDLELIYGARENRIALRFK